jgi:hypothetical protein
MSPDASSSMAGGIVVGAGTAALGIGRRCI